ncbi:hypothetical protein L873DRAFT_1696117 [Choiromyces venosus 120613-1]|uniref:Nucleotide exchange factor SIL1 n=1 Tax=Choiromyces venosus 120613-1 TaxID=1336337 RepID=A0A3N4JCN9_9PEZI|nr:hypothetical protein L873DRAFT_1696117 [Choiromyces venosus 120613-1]
MRSLLLPYLLAVPALVTAVSARQSHNQPKHTSHEGSSELICHGGTCYPKVFQPTDEFQIVHDDQELPPGLHYRLNLETGLKEAKINVDDGSEAINSVVVLPAQEAESLPSDDHPKQRVPSSDDGAIKPPLSASGDGVTFSESLEIILDASSRSTSDITTALLSLEDLAHEIYWGLQISAPRYVAGLLRLIRSAPDASIRSSSALVLGNALSNNPKALASATSDGHVPLIRSLLSSLEIEKDTSAKARILYALNKAIKSALTRSEFLIGGGMRTLQDLFAQSNAEFMVKTATFLEDNFLNDDMRAESELKAETGVKKQDNIPNRYRPDHVLNDERNFYQPFEDALLNRANQKDLENDDFKSKVFSALSALKRKYPGDEACTPSVDFLAWLGDQADLKGKTLLELEEEGNQLTKLLAVEYRSLFVGSSE